jgi:hypothetical protein
MDSTKIPKFLSLALNSAEYKIKGGAINPVLDKNYTILGSFEQGSLIYSSSCRGFENISGKEVILHKGKPVWQRFYKGGVTSKELTREEIIGIYDFLKNALTYFPKSDPHQRGPNEYADGDFEYTGKCFGSFENFKGTEEIFFKGKSVYKLSYYS